MLIETPNMMWRECLRDDEYEYEPKCYGQRREYSGKNIFNPFLVSSRNARRK
jgi:hypothetical protein